MGYIYNGEKFLDILYSQLYKSEEVQHTKEKRDTKEESIKRYMDRLENIHKKANTERKKEIVKKIYFNKYVIKKENIPSYINSIDKKAIIESQKKTLSLWIDYLTDENAIYPMWAKYWIFQQMLKMGTYDEINNKFTKRNKKTINPFVEANPEVIAKCIDNLTLLLGDKKLSTQQIRKLISNVSFEKKYIEYQKNVKNQYKRNEGIWIKYNQGNKEDGIKLSKSLKGYNTGWCTASEFTAVSQLCGGLNYVGGDFYVYYTKNKNNEYKVPRIAIRLNGPLNIGEIRGVEEHQNLEKEMIPALENKLKEMKFLSDEDVDKNIKKINDLKYLLKIKEKILCGIQLNSNELIDLYTKKFGFGWEQDPLIEKLIEKRNVSEDYKLLENKSTNIKKMFILKNYEVFDKLNVKRFITGKDVIKEIIDENPELLKYVEKEYIINKKFVMEIIKKNALAIDYIDSSLQKDKEIILLAAKKYSSALDYASPELKNNKEYMMEILKHNVGAKKYIGEELTFDEDIYLIIVKANAEFINYVPNKLLNDREFILKLAKVNGLILNKINSRFMMDREIVLEAVKENSLVYTYIYNNYKWDEEIAFEAIKKNNFPILYIDNSLLKKKSFVLKAIKINGWNYRYISEELQKDETIALEAIKNTNGKILLDMKYLTQINNYKNLINIGILEFEKEYLKKILHNNIDNDTESLLIKMDEFKNKFLDIIDDDLEIENKINNTFNKLETKIKQKTKRR